MDYPPSQHLHTPPSKPRRVVILGSSGFIGRKLNDKLAAGDIETHGVRSSDINLCSTDSVAALRNILRPDDAVVFAAAITPDKGKDIRAFMKNLEMVEHVVEALGNAPPAHLIYMSSDAVFDEDMPSITESTAASPSTLYGLMHFARERMLAGALEKTKTPYLVLRPCAVYGAGDTHNSYGPNRFIRSAVKDGKIRLFGQGEEKRPHVFIDDLVAILVAALLRRTVGILHAIPGESVSFGAIAQILCRLTNGRANLETLPRSGPITHKHYDPTALLRAFPGLRWTPIEKGLETVLRQPVCTGKSKSQNPSSK